MQLTYDTFWRALCVKDISFLYFLRYIVHSSRILWGGSVGKSAARSIPKSSMKWVDEVNTTREVVTLAASARSGITMYRMILAQICSWMHLKKAHRHREYHEHATIVNNTDVLLGEPNHWFHKFWDNLLREPGSNSLGKRRRSLKTQSTRPCNLHSCDLQVQVYKPQLQRYLQQRSAFFFGIDSRRRINTKHCCRVRR